VYLVMENSAGAGQLCGGTIEELGALVRTIGHPQLAVCLDTAIPGRPVMRSILPTASTGSSSWWKKSWASTAS
jgi:hypothetical protein